MGSRNQKARVAISSHYYKTLMRKDGAHWHSISFMLENNNAKNGASWNEVRPIAENAITSLEAIEERAEATFHPGLNRPDLIQSLDGTN